VFRHFAGQDLYFGKRCAHAALQRMAIVAV
jgi:hypothetical protein